MRMYEVRVTLKNGHTFTITGATLEVLIRQAEEMAGGGLKGLVSKELKNE